MGPWLPYTHTLHITSPVAFWYSSGPSWHKRDTLRGTAPATPFCHIKNPTITGTRDALGDLVLTLVRSVGSYFGAYSILTTRISLLHCYSPSLGHSGLPRSQPSYEHAFFSVGFSGRGRGATTPNAIIVDDMMG